MGEPNPAPLTGWFVPPLELEVDGQTRRIAELLRGGRPLLLDLTGSRELAIAFEPWAKRVQRVAATGKDSSAPALLIRPDGYVAWSGGEPGGLTAALARWFGAS